MRLADLQSLGAFVDTAPVKKTITWRATPDGEELTGEVFVVRQPFGEVERALGDLDNERSRGAKLIAMSIRLGENGDEQLTYEQAYQLTPAFAWALVTAINEVNQAPKA